MTTKDPTRLLLRYLHYYLVLTAFKHLKIAQPPLLATSCPFSGQGFGEAEGSIIIPDVVIGMERRRRWFLLWA